MRKEQEAIEINKLYIKFKNAETDREKVEIFTALSSLLIRFNHVITEENAKLIDKMEMEYFFPEDADGTLDEVTQNHRITAYNEWLMDRLTLLGLKIEEYKEKIDAVLPPSKDEKGRDEHLELAKKFGEASEEGKIICDDGDMKNVLFTHSGDEIAEKFGDIAKKIEKKMSDNYLEMLDNLPPEKRRLCELAKEPYHNTPFVKEYYDETLEDIEDAKHYKNIVENPILEDLIGDRELDYNNVPQINSWHRVRNDKKMDSLMSSIKGNTRGSHKNSDLYQKIIDTYERACDAPSATEFAHEMKQLSIACKNYIDHRHPIYSDGKARLDLIKRLDAHIDKELMPTIDKKVDAFEVVDFNTLIKEMEEEEINDTGKRKQPGRTKPVKSIAKDSSMESLV